MSHRKIYDCFIFFNELDILELRLEQHWAKVDHFVICESSQTFQGKPKPLHYFNNRDRFSQFAKKIIHVVVDDLPDGPSPWEREFFQRNAIRRGLSAASDDDLVIIADCDEIISNQTFDFMRANRGFFFLDMAMYQFFVNMLAHERGWLKVFAFSWPLLAQISDFNLPRIHELAFFQDFDGEKHFIENAGWHFTFLGGADRVRQKLEAYSHTDSWQVQMLAGGIDTQMLELRDVGGGRRLEYREIGPSFPDILTTRLKYYLKINFVKTASKRIQELEMLAAIQGQEIRRARLMEARTRFLETEQNCLINMDALRLVNLAVGKVATQSSTSQWSNSPTAEVDAAGANNGYLTGGVGFHTDIEENPWWQVDLDAVCNIQQIHIYNRQDQASRLKHFSVLASENGEIWAEIGAKTDDVIFGENSFIPYIFIFPTTTMARYIRLRLNGFDFLHFDECMIFGNVA